MFEWGHFFIIIGLLSDIVGASLIIYPILTFIKQINFNSHIVDNLYRENLTEITKGFFQSDNKLDEIIDSTNERIEELEEKIDDIFNKLAIDHNKELMKEKQKIIQHQRFAKIGFIILGFGFFMQIAGVLLLSRIIYGN